MTKGKRRERGAEEIYQSAEFETYRPPRTKYSENDLFGLFDILAIRGGQIRLAQVKANRAQGIESWIDTAAQYVSGPQVRAHFLVCHDGHGGPHATPPKWRLYEDWGDGRGEWVIDEREFDDGEGEAIARYLRVTNEND